MSSSLFGGSSTTKSESTPWAPQGDALKGIFDKAGALYSSKADTPWYEGELYAQMDPATRQAVQNMMAYSQGQGQQSASQLTQAGSQLADPSKLTGAIDRFSTAAGADPTQSNIAAATAYANNPAIDGMIDAASRDVNRNLYETELPGINRAATASGNANSSRAGVAEGIATRGAADRVGDISSTIRGQAFDRGLNLAEQGRSTNLSAMGQTAGLYGDSLRTGMGALEGGNNLALGNFGAAVDAGKLFQQDDQGKLDADFSKWQGNDTRASDLLDRYYNIVGSNNWGGTQTQTQKQSNSIFGSLLGAASLASGFGLFGGGGK